MNPMAALIELDMEWLSKHPAMNTDTDSPLYCIHGVDMDDECAKCRRYNHAKINRCGPQPDIIWIECRKCECRSAFPFSRDEEADWRSGTPLPVAAPRLNEYQITYLHTGICSRCIDELAAASFDLGPEEPEAF